MAPTRAANTLLIGIGTNSRVQCVPKGRVLILGPYNYPVNLTLGPLVSAIAAGNTVIIKPSEMTPAISAFIARIVRECFGEDEVALFEGEVDVAKSLLDLPFDHIFFTGQKKSKGRKRKNALRLLFSVRFRDIRQGPSNKCCPPLFFTGSPMVGKIVMAAAAKHLTSVTLELGGKSPTIIDESANIHLAAQNVCFGKFSNSGQTCIAPDFVYVHASVKEAFVEACRKEIAKVGT